MPDPIHGQRLKQLRQGEHSQLVDDALREIARLQALNADLLGALKYAVAVDAEWRSEHGESLRTPEYQESYDRCIAAIDKAEGRSVSE
jgi:hypothetical protein